MINVGDFHMIIDSIKAGSSPVAIASGPKIILHLLPASVFSPGEASEISLNHPLLKEFTALEDPRAGGSKGNRINLEGLTNYAGAYKPYRAYTQIQRSGVVEAVRGLEQDLRKVQVEGAGKGPNRINVVFADFYEPLILQAVPKYLKLLGKLGVPFPIFMFLSLTDVGGGHYVLSRRQIEERGSSGLFVFIDDLEGHHPIDCVDLLLPPTVIEDGAADASQKLAHLLEMIWNASGSAEHG
jgi:hypothetical protein